MDSIVSPSSANTGDNSSLVKRIKLGRMSQLDILLLVRFSLMALVIVNFPRPVLNAICLAKRPDSEKIKILALIEVGMDFMM